MTASISAHSTNIASIILHAYAYHYNLSLCMCHVQPTVYQRNSYCILDIHVTEAIHSCTPISHAPLIYGMLFTHADNYIDFSCERHVAHKCVTYKNLYVFVFNPLYLYNCQGNIYQICIFYAIYKHDAAYQITRKLTM